MKLVYFTADERKAAICNLWDDLGNATRDIWAIDDMKLTEEKIDEIFDPILTEIERLDGRMHWQESERFRGVWTELFNATAHHNVINETVDKERKTDSERRDT